MFKYISQTIKCTMILYRNERMNNGVEVINKMYKYRKQFKKKR
jgi:hypothetical protein